MATIPAIVVAVLLMAVAELASANSPWQYYSPRHRPRRPFRRQSPVRHHRPAPRLPPSSSPPPPPRSSPPPPYQSSPPPTSQPNPLPPSTQPPASPSGPAAGFQASGWQDGSATFYGDDSGLGGDFGGACGYSAENIASLYSVRTAALSTPLFADGNGCGRCYEIRCVKSPNCYAGSPSVIVTGTNLCPPNWYQDSNNGGWCNPPRQHFDLAPPTFYKLAPRVAGVVPVQFRRVPCQRSGGVRFYVTGNNHWLLLHIMNVGGPGDISAVSVRPADSSNWIQASQNWGITYQAFSALDKTVGLVVKITTGSSPQKTVVIGDAIPADWVCGLTYQGSTNLW